MIVRPLQADGALYIQVVRDGRALVFASPLTYSVIIAYVLPTTTQGDRK